MKNKKPQTSSSPFPSVHPAEAADRRSSRHGKIVSEILSDLEKLDEHSAIKVNLFDTTTSNEKHLYVFRKLPRSR
jgi:hypothetical protein